MPSRTKVRRWALPLATLLLVFASLRPLRFTFHLMAGYFTQHLRGEETRAVGHFARLFDLRRNLRLPAGPLSQEAGALALVRRYARAAGADRERLAALARELLGVYPANLYLAAMAGAGSEGVAADDLLAVGLGNPDLDRFTLASIGRSGPRGPDRPVWLGVLADFARWQGNSSLAGRISALPGAPPLASEPPAVAPVGTWIDWSALLDRLRAMGGATAVASSPSPCSPPAAGAAPKATARRLLATDLAGNGW
ncbi:MAG TPA: hypothetical protein PKK12_11680, partial [Candidatus Aminicenantes bacterium]|nr:hypothetical protein [Candidatus Aminicenantes bacterium]